MRLDGNIKIILAEAEIRDNALRLVGQLDRKTYLAVNDVLAALGGKWNRKTKAHLFPETSTDLAELIDTVIETGEIETVRESRKRLGWFATPAPLAAKLVDMAEVRPKHDVLEPSAGEGAILRAIVAALNGSAVPTAVELDPGRCKKLEPILGGPAVCCDFLSCSYSNVDRVVMNPPFGPHLAHVLHALGMLARSGRLVSVLPGGVRFREDKKHQSFRYALTKGADRFWFEDLPDGSFAESGTMVNTCVLVVEGWS